jgi:hypothetical protein
MSRISRALGAMTMTAAAAGAWLLIAAAGAVPVYAAPATTAPPPGGHTVTITATATAQATGTPGAAVLPCATVPGASCLPQTITCWINVPPPFAQMQIIVATASVHCDHQVDAINLDQTLSEGSEIVEVKSDHPAGATDAFTITGDGNCQGGLEYDNFGFATINFPAGYTPVYPPGYLHHLESYVPLPSACAPPGTPIITCATAPPPTPPTPSPSIEPARVTPHLHTC